MKLQAKILLLFLAGLYLLTRWARTHASIPDFFKNHFTDLLFVPVQLMIALWMTRLIKRDRSIQISIVWIFLQVVLVSFLFEWYMPHFGKDRIHFTADYIDVLMYAIGGIGFVFIQKWEYKLRSQNSGSHENACHAE